MHKTELLLRRWVDGARDEGREVMQTRPYHEGTRDLSMQVIS